MTKLFDIIKKWGNTDNIFICHGNDKNDILIVDLNGDIIERYNINGA